MQSHIPSFMLWPWEVVNFVFFSSRFILAVLWLGLWWFAGAFVILSGALTPLRVLVVQMKEQKQWADEKATLVALVERNQRTISELQETLDKTYHNSSQQVETKTKAFNSREESLRREKESLEGHLETCRKALVAAQAESALMQQQLVKVRGDSPIPCSFFQRVH